MHKLIYFLLVIGAAVSSPSTPVKKCKGVTEDLFKRVVVSTPKGVCTKLPCNLISGEDVKTDITFDVRREEIPLYEIYFGITFKICVTNSTKGLYNLVTPPPPFVEVLKHARMVPHVSAHTVTYEPLTLRLSEVQKITLKSNATSLGVTIDYPITNADKGCDMLTNTYCPVEPDTEADLTFKMHVSKIFPKVSVDLVIYLLDQNLKMISCFEVSTKVVENKFLATQN